MLLQTNSYIVPKDKRAEHARLLQRFRQCLARLGCEHFEAYEQVGANWSGNETTGRFVQLMRFKDRKQQQAVQAAERTDPAAQALIKEFCELINFPYQQQQGFFAVGFYQGIMALNSPLRPPPSLETESPSQSAPASQPPPFPEMNDNGSPSAPPPLPVDEVHPPDIHGEAQASTLEIDQQVERHMDNLDIIDDVSGNDDAGEIIEPSPDSTSPESLRAEQPR